MTSLSQPFAFAQGKIRERQRDKGIAGAGRPSRNVLPGKIEPVQSVNIAKLPGSSRYNALLLKSVSHIKNGGPT